MVAFDAPDNLSKSVSSGSIIDIMPDCESSEASELLSTIDEIEETEIVKESDESCNLKLHINGEDSLSICKKIFKLFASNDIALLQLSTEKTTLEDIFIELTRNEEDMKNDSGIKA